MPDLGAAAAAPVATSEAKSATAAIDAPTATPICRSII
jgi:hypothetical protein